MKFNIGSWFRENYNRLINSIAFYPAIIALLFLVLSGLSITFDFSELGKEIKLNLHWLRLKDPSTARSIISSIAAGIISLTVFSFSMVMIVLNQTASQMSNRILDKLIGSRFQQVVLGVYVGTIVYALFLLSTIRDVETGIQIPALSTYFLIALTICDIFLFIYFLHYITQSVKYDVIIKRIYEETLDSMKSLCNADDVEDEEISFSKKSTIVAGKSGIYEGFNKHALLELCDRHKCVVSLLHPAGTFLLAGNPVANTDSNLSEEVLEEFQSELYIHKSETINENYFYGFRQLTEVGIKALSPGINDPGTAIQVMQALFELFEYRIRHSVNTHIRNQENDIRIVRKELTFEEIFETTLLPIWDYGKNDRMVRAEFHHLLTQMLAVSSKKEVSNLLKEVDLAINSQTQ
jgi:uncharacterized membrane protein